MLLGALNAQYVRQTYLRGIDLGAAWQGPGATAAMERLLETQMALAERLLGVWFCRRRILTMPDTGQMLGRDYEIVGVSMPYVALVPGTETYALTLPFPQVQTVQQVRLFEGYTGGPTPTPIFETVPLNQTALSELDGKLRFASSLVTQPLLGESWAVDYTIGLGTIPLEIVEWVTLNTAIQVLSIAGSGQDMGAGLGGWSLDQDGITERTEMVRDTYGPYSGTIRLLLALRAANDIVRWRMHYQGVRL